MKITDKIFGTHSEREIKRINAKVGDYYIRESQKPGQYIICHNVCRPVAEKIFALFFIDIHADSTDMTMLERVNKRL